MCKDKSKTDNNIKEDVDMDTVLSIKDYMTEKKFAKTVTSKKTNKAKRFSYSDNEFEELYEAENRHSGSDEFPLLWNEEE